MQLSCVQTVGLLLRLWNTVCPFIGSSLPHALSLSPTFIVLFSYMDRVSMHCLSGGKGVVHTLLLSV